MYVIDSVEILAALTPDFMIIEDTLMLSGTELIARLKEGGTDTKWHAEFSDLQTRFEGDVAWTTLRNHETAVGADGLKCQADYLETIVFVREDERWLIDRYHAAMLNAWTCEE
jgi:ketosteroid isomerase-like protein